MMTTIGQPSAGKGSLMALGAICSAQLGGAFSVVLLDRIGVLELTWMRLVLAAVILGVLARPWQHAFAASTLLTCLLLGLISGGMSITYMISVTMLPLGTATALQFLGPLGIAVFHLPRAAKLWALVPALGVVALTEPWKGAIDTGGILIALASGLLWALYIVLMQIAGDDAGLSTLAISVPAAAVVATFAMALGGIGSISLDVIPLAFIAAVLLPVTPFVLELLALRRLTAQSFGVLMSLQPAVAVLVGFVLLGQLPSLFAVLGICLVVVAGIGAARTGARTGTAIGVRAANGR